ncbi:hypothetical protein [Salinibaculum rarum]|uniref:hypothetical protein n=1 Tax=Salinibaculum rarum TaxID=3058903 RepID=UPI00265E74B1|nr:hypothetical protein [Salinibaculum sp. KK48]
MSMSLYYDAGDREYPTLMNTGGLNSILSASKAVGGDTGIEPTEHFFDAIAYTFHWLQSYRPLPTNREQIREEIENEMETHYPNEKVPSHERWAIHLIVTQMYLAPDVPSEWEPIVAYCDSITGFSVPDLKSE